MEMQPFEKALYKLIQNQKVTLKSCGYCGNSFELLHSENYKNWLEYYESLNLDYQDQIPSCPACGIHDNCNL